MKRFYWGGRFFLFLLLVSALSACSPSGNLPEGRWEMYVGEDQTLAGQINGTDGLRYVIELNPSERTFEPESEALAGRKSYGWMDFSNTSRIYRYDIDSVYDLGNHRYRVVSMDVNWETPSEDTLTYDPKANTLTYGRDWVFQHVEDIRPFTGVWGGAWDDGSSEEFHLSLYKKMKAPDDYPFDGAECFGYIVSDNEVDSSYRLITSVVSVHYDQAVVETVFQDYPEDGAQRLSLYYNRQNGSLGTSWGNEYPPLQGTAAPTTQEEIPNNLVDALLLVSILSAVALALFLLCYKPRAEAWVGGPLLWIQAILALALAWHVVGLGGLEAPAGAGAGYVLKLYACVLLAGVTMCVGVVKQFEWFGTPGEDHSAFPTLIVFILSAVFPVLAFFGGETLLSEVFSHFGSALFYGEGTMAFLMALDVALLAVAIVVQMGVLAYRERGYHRPLLLVAYPVVMVATSLMMMVALLALVYLAIIALVIALVIAVMGAAAQAHTSSSGKGYLVDQYGNKKRVTNMERGILGEKFVTTEDGKHYHSSGGDEMTPDE